MPSISKRYYLCSWLLLMILINTTLLTACTSQQQIQHPQHITGNSHLYHISKNDNNGDGLSWATAWNELDQINWSVIQPGDTILRTGEEAVYMDTGCSNDAIRNLESCDNGAIDGSSPAAWGGGMLLYGSNHVFDRVNIHGDAGDAFQPSGTNITIASSWLHQ